MADTAREMTFDQFLEHAYGEIKKAILDEATVAKARLAHLRTEVDRIAKLSFEDSESEKMQVTVFQEPRTAASDETGSGASSQTPENDSAASNTAMTPEDMSKLDEVTKKVDALLSETQTELEKGLGDEGWPFDMNDQHFEDGEAVPQDDPSWGWDPAEQQPQT